MLHILLGSHGHLASGMKTAIEILAGKQNNLTVIDAYVDQRNIDEELRDFFNAVQDEEQVLMLSDLYGGSVNQKMYLYLQRPNTFLVAGVNLALVLEFCMLDKISLEMLEVLVQQAKQVQKVVVLDNNDSIEEETFF